MQHAIRAQSPGMKNITVFGTPAILHNREEKKEMQNKNKRLNFTYIASKITFENAGSFNQNFLNQSPRAVRCELRGSPRTKNTPQTAIFTFIKVSYSWKSRLEPE